MRAAPPDSGFTIVELLVATALTMAVMGAVLSLTGSAQRAFQLEGEALDMHQRVRASVDALATDLRTAGGSEAPVRPYRVGDVRDDGLAGIYYRPDTISLFHRSTDDPSVVESHTYYLKQDPASNSMGLMQYDGHGSDLPIVDHLDSLSFAYIGDPGVLDPAVFTDGPWSRAVSGELFDADLLRIRSVEVRLRIRSPLGARLVPDVEVRFRVAIRNLITRSS